MNAWLCAIDHKRVGILYMLSALLFFLARSSGRGSNPLERRRSELTALATKKFAGFQPVANRNARSNRASTPETPASQNPLRHFFA